MDLSKNDVTQKPREGQIRRDEVQWTAMSISFKQGENGSEGALTVVTCAETRDLSKINWISKIFS